MSVRTLKPGEVVGERYLVEELIGRGGMATVYRVRHTQLDTLHALKVVSLSARSVQRRMLQEGRVQAALRHPNIVSVTDIIIVEESPGLVMEYIRGPSLEDFLDKHDLSIEQIDELAQGILAGVEAAHDHGLIHRDLKPANVMLELAGNRLVPKVADFGLVKMIAEESGDGDEGVKSRTRTGVTMGTPAYMAPEQIRDAKNVDARADVFSLGAILYEMVSGERAFQGTDILEIFNAVAESRRIPVREHVPELPDRMEKAIEMALLSDRDERLANVAGLMAVWAGKDPTAVASNWDMDLLSSAESLGAGGEDTKQYLEKSFKSDLALTRPNIDRSGGGTMPLSEAATQAPQGGSAATMVPDEIGGATTVPEDSLEEHVSVPTMYPDEVGTPAAGTASGAAATAPNPTSEGRSGMGIAVAGSMFGLFGIGIAVLAVIGVGLFLAFGSTGSTADTDTPLVDVTPPDEPTGDDTPEEPTGDGTPDAAGSDTPEEPDDAGSDGSAAGSPDGADGTTDATPPDEPPDPANDGGSENTGVVATKPVEDPFTPPEEPAEEPDADTDDAVAEVTPEEPEEPEAPPEPAAPAGPTVAMATDVTVVLRDSSGARADINALKPGEYTVIAFFEPTRATTISKVNMPSGSRWTIQCRASARRCNVTPQ